MKKIILISLIVSVFFTLAGCTVNDTTGRIEVTNMSDKEATNIKVGSTIIIYNLAAGQTLDYWFFADMVGKVTAEGGFDSQPAVVVEGLVNNPESEARFKVGYHGLITLQLQSKDGPYQIMADIGSKQQ